MKDKVNAKRNENFNHPYSNRFNGTLVNALEKSLLADSLTSHEIILRRKYNFETIVGHSPQMIEILEAISHVAITDAPVLIQGETGTGKELVAHAVHSNSKRWQMPLITVNCGAFPDNLLESEFFGHEKGAFTGAFKSHKGKFEQADGGTFFLDEIDDMSPVLQVKLLRVLQCGEFSALGSEKIKRCDVRVIAASKKPLHQLVEDGKFRDDLYYRLNLVLLELPPLRERKEDILLLANCILEKACQNLNKPLPKLTPEVKVVIRNYQYPGNIRELENIIQRAAIFCNEETVKVHHLPREIRPTNIVSRLKVDDSAPETFHNAKKKIIEEFERNYLKQMLDECNGVIRRAAIRAGLQEKNFHLKLKKYGIRPPQR